MRACCNKKEDNFITYHQSREKTIDRVRDWEKLNPEKRKEYTIKYYKTEQGHRKRLAQQKRYREKKKLKDTIIKLQQENKILKEQCEIVEKRLVDEYEDMLDKRNKLFIENCKLKKQVECLLNQKEMILTSQTEISQNNVKYLRQNNLYKSVIDEIETYVEYRLNPDKHTKRILEILDKAKEIRNESKKEIF